MKISIIIPCYNQGKYIAECLDSVLLQTLQDWEAIVVNDGSIDNSLQIIEKYLRKDDRIKLIDQENQGVIVARNNAINISQGEFIYPLDADDKIAPECLALLHEAMIEGKGDVIYSEVKYFGNMDAIMRLNAPTKLNMSLMNCVVCSALYRKTDAFKYNGYDVNMKDGLEDWEFWCNFIYDNKKFYKLPQILFFYRQIEKSRNKTFDEKTAKQLERYIRRKHKLFIYYYLRKFLGNIYINVITKSNKHLVKICKIPVYYKKVK